VVVMNPDKARDMPFLRKRAAHLFSKSRFVAAQFEAYFQDDLWLANARHANEMAARLAETVRTADRLRLAWEAQANEVFAIMKTPTAKALADEKVYFHPWNPHGAEASL